MESRVRYPNTPLPVFVSVKIMTKNAEKEKNALNESRAAGYDKHIRVENVGPEKRVYNEILLIVSYEYKKGLL